MQRIEVKELLHVNVEVRDVEQALVFYQRLGLEKIPREGTPGRPGGWFRFPDGRELHISAGVPKPESRAHFAVRVDDLDAARRVMHEAGAPIETERALPGLERFFTRDPDGNRIEFIQRI